jgi:murein DD-endopeptidase MepM/ murein hydrolase activator NlpD
MIKRQRRPRLFAVMIACFCAGALTDWWANQRTSSNASPARNTREVQSLSKAPSITPSVSPPSVASGSSTSSPNSAGSPAATSGVIEPGRVHLPIDGVDPDSFKGQFAERRGERAHEAIDILAPRNTPVHAVADGTIAKLFFSKAGGTTIYQFDPKGDLCFYYAHLERYADGLHEGQQVSRGDVIGYVGTSGNAPPDTPHLHFAVFRLNADRHWWQGQPLDPYLLFHGEASG